MFNVIVIFNVYNINFKKKNQNFILNKLEEGGKKTTSMQTNLRSFIGLLGERVIYVTVGMLHRPIGIQESVL